MHPVSATSAECQIEHFIQHREISFNLGFLLSKFYVPTSSPKQAVVGATADVFFSGNNLDPFQEDDFRRYI